jgi:hypothetical protein
MTTSSSMRVKARLGERLTQSRSESFHRVTHCFWNDYAKSSTRPEKSHENCFLFGAGRPTSESGWIGAFAGRGSFGAGAHVHFSRARKAPIWRSPDLKESRFKSRASLDRGSPSTVLPDG